jgi:hypothetical protein
MFHCDVSIPKRSFQLIPFNSEFKNIYLVSEALNLKCCALGGFRISDEQMERILDIDGVTESLVYTAVIGK